MIDLFSSKSCLEALSGDNGMQKALGWLVWLNHVSFLAFFQDSV